MEKVVPTPTVLDGRYTLEECISTGDVVDVWRGHDEVLARSVAVKVLDTARRSTLDVDRFISDGVAAAKLLHPNIIAIYDSGVHDNFAYLVMEYFEGSTLASLIHDDALAPSTASRIIRFVADALAYGHERGLVHGSVRPSNIFIGTDEDVKVANFGFQIGAQTDPNDRFQPHGESVFHCADCYALGVTLHDTLVGPGCDVVVGPGLRPSTLTGDVPNDLDQAVFDLTTPDLDPPINLGELIVTLRNNEVTTPPPLDVHHSPFTRATNLHEVGWMLPIGVLLAIITMLISVGLFSGVTPENQVTSVTAEVISDVQVDSTFDVDPSVDRATPIEIINVVAFDPFGDEHERDQDLPNVLDGDPETVWMTEKYWTAQFGNLKPGVGFYLDLGEPARLASVSLNVVQGGFGLEIRTTSQSTVFLDEWSKVANIDQVPDGPTTVNIPLGTARRYVLIWIVGELPPSDSGFRAEIQDVTATAWE